jgi:hypothetical protein
MVAIRTLAAFVLIITFALFVIRRHSKKQNRKKHMIEETRMANLQLSRVRATLGRMGTMERSSRFESNDTTLGDVPLDV